MEELSVNILGMSFVIPVYAKQLIIAAILGLLMGTERLLRRKVASIRTFSIISTGSCLFAVLSVHAVGGENGGNYDVTRIAAGIVTGIGFVGGGVIFKTTNRIEGITTGVMIWLAAGVGMACGLNQVNVAYWSVGIYFAILGVSFMLHKVVDLFKFGTLKRPYLEDLANP